MSNRDGMTFLTTQEPQRPVGRHPDDFYSTPRWATVAMLSEGAWPTMATLVLEPSCGDGAILDALKETLRKVSGPVRRFVGIELNRQRAMAARDRGHNVEVADFLASSDIGDDLTWVVGNPPFSLAQEFTEHSLSIVPVGSRVTFLLRLAFLSSHRRAHLYEGDSGFRYLQVLPRRPSFTPDGGTDKYDYAWFTWERGYQGPATVTRLEAR